MIQVNKVDCSAICNNQCLELRAILVLAGMNQKSLAKMIGVTPGFISRVVRGKQKSSRVLETIKGLKRRANLNALDGQIGVF